VQAKLLNEMDVRVGYNPNRTPIIEKRPAGTIIDNPQAFMLVRMGAAEAADEECRLAAGMTPEQFDDAVYAQQRTAAGIHPDDFAAYDRGEMIGYERGTLKPIPGPNFRPSANRRARKRRQRHQSRSN
jgi:hypothetical protein